MLTHQLPDQAGHQLGWQTLYGSSASLALSDVIHKHLVIYVCAEAQQQIRTATELQFYCNNNADILSFPDWECLPYDRVSPHPDITSNRLQTLYKLPNKQSGLVITSMNALMQRLPPVSYINAFTFDLQVNQDINVEEFKQQLVDAGYYSVNQVMQAGEFAVRGGTIDVFPSGQAQPFRLDLFDTQIESIKLFDTDSQRSNQSLDNIRLLPAREIPTDKESIQAFRQAFRHTVDGDPRKAQVYNDLSQGFTPAGSEFYLPLFFDQTSTLFDYINANALFVFEEGALESIEKISAETEDRYQNAQLDQQWPPLSPTQLFLDEQSIYAALKAHRRIDLLNLNLRSRKHVYKFGTVAPTQFNLNHRSEKPYAPVIEYLQQTPKRILIIAESAGRRESLREILKDHHIQCELVDNWQAFLNTNSQICLTESSVERGINLEEQQIEIITETQLYGQRSLNQRRRSNKNRDPDAIIKSLAELNVGDPVVHDDHGVGRYQGLQTLNLDGENNEFMTLSYAGDDKVYIPVLSLDRVSRYVGGSPETAPLHSMGSEQWVKIRKKAKDKAYDVAAELLEIQALRLARKGHAFPALDEAYHSFASGFEFEETPDQLQVIDDVINDMVSERPMDRLVCGDVGFGKTEIALRAAYLAIAGNKQVIMLVPTTLLAQQHYETFTDRFADWPVQIELLSRFRTAKQTQLAIEGLAAGKVDIVIGTHKLLQSDINFNDLGLMLIDEEHRFGVRQKERLKQMRSQVDILTLTATPIPRTLNFALSGLRDISILATPPKTRLAVKTMVREWNDGLVREAILREIRRGGQVYFLHNEVRTIDKLAEQLQQIAPEAKIQIAHGQMRERELEVVMRDFYHQRFNLLLCTTIIESGIDNPTANTIIINKADRFGLAQLHQLRGRVGRSHHQAYAYLLSPPDKSMTDDAQRRLTAIESLDTLGAGFALASQDLEIRGAGELLGETQSGMIDQVGYSMYSTYLDQAIRDINNKRAQKKGETIVENNGLRLDQVEINLHVPARFPDDYLPDVHLRLSMYKRISGAQNLGELKSLKIESIDRFGLLPDAAANLFTVAELKLMAWQKHIRSIEVGPKGGRFKLLEGADINIDKLIQTLAKQPDVYGFDGADVLRVTKELPELEDRLQAINEIIELISYD